MGCSNPKHNVKCSIWIPYTDWVSIMERDYKTAIEKSAMGPQCRMEF
jgi:hypothetical protein